MWETPAHLLWRGLVSLITGDLTGFWTYKNRSRRPPAAPAFQDTVHVVKICKHVLSIYMCAHSFITSFTSNWQDTFETQRSGLAALNCSHSLLDAPEKQLSLWIWTDPCQWSWALCNRWCRVRVSTVQISTLPESSVYLWVKQEGKVSQIRIWMWNMNIWSRVEENQCYVLLDAKYFPCRWCNPEFSWIRINLQGRQHIFRV